MPSPRAAASIFCDGEYREIFQVPPTVSLSHTTTMTTKRGPSDSPPPADVDTDEKWIDRYVFTWSPVPANAPPPQKGHSAWVAMNNTPGSDLVKFSLRILNPKSKIAATDAAEVLKDSIKTLVRYPLFLPLNHLKPHYPSATPVLSFLPTVPSHQTLLVSLLVSRSSLNTLGMTMSTPSGSSALGWKFQSRCAILPHVFSVPNRPLVYSLRSQIQAFQAYAGSGPGCHSGRTAPLHREPTLRATAKTSAR